MPTWKQQCVPRSSLRSPKEEGVKSLGETIFSPSWFFFMQNLEGFYLSCAKLVKLEEGVRIRVRWARLGTAR
ncbi:mCG1042836 [Mus musculus]|nr:mCG1042836 [Mus musculus]